MGRRYKGSFITSTAPVTTSNSSTAAGLWSMDQQMQLQGACLWPRGVTPPGQQVFVGGCYTWIAPPGVTSISMVAVGQGSGGQGPTQGYFDFYCGCNYPYVFYVNYNFNASGGAGGGLAYRNNITVVPGTSYTVRANASVSRICGTATSAVATPGSGTNYPGTGTSGCAGSTGGPGNFGDYYCYTVGGSQTFSWPSQWGWAGGGGGAAGYSGTGGLGRSYSSGDSGTGGAGGGGGGSNYGTNPGYSTSGGGVGLLGAGASGAGGAVGNSGQPGSGGSGAQYGGGGGGAAAVRIMWPGTTRTYPNNAGNV